MRNKMRNKPLDYFVALGSHYIMKHKGYVNNTDVIIIGDEQLKAQEVGQKVCDILKAVEIMLNKPLSHLAATTNYTWEYFDYIYNIVVLEDEERTTHEEFDFIRRVLK